MNENLPNWATPLHPKTLTLRRPDGSLRRPSYEEWHGDYGIGYVNKKNWDDERLNKPLLGRGL